MTTDGMSNQQTYVYLGLAGETGSGRVVHSGLFRMADGSGEWQALREGLPEAPAVRALAVHPQKPEIVYAGTQSGAYRSADRGEHWEKVEMPDHGLPVWSVLFHPHDPDVILVGCENCEIYRSDDAGERWTRLPVSVRFPEITTAPGANPAKRVLKMDASASEPDLLVRRDRGRRHDPLDGWRRALGKFEPRPVPERRHGRHARRAGQPLAAGHGLRHRPRPACSTAPTAATTGGRWRSTRSTPRATIYCRDIKEVPGNPRHLWVRGRRQLPERCRRACCAAATAATAGPGSRWARRCRTRCSASPSTSASRAGCRAPPMAARSTPASTPARAGAPSRHRPAAPRSTPWPAGRPIEAGPVLPG